MGDPVKRPSLLSRGTQVVRPPATWIGHSIHLGIITSLIWALGLAACNEANAPVTVDDLRDSSRLGVPSRFGFGKPATHAQIENWDIDVMPDGTGLPLGEGTVETGAIVFAQLCATCHGTKGEGGSGGPLVVYETAITPPFGPQYEEWRQGRDDVPFVIGNYWPHATTLFDYIRRAMPSQAPGSLNADEVYGLVAWLLVQNAIIPEDFVMNSETLPQIRMPARDLFVPDARRGGPEVR